MRRWWLRSSWIRGDGAGSALRSSRQWRRVVTMKNITPTADQPPAIPDKPKRISRRVRSAIDALVAGDVKTIADLWELSRLFRNITEAQRRE
jgi:hypothetical protein